MPTGRRGVGCQGKIGRRVSGPSGPVLTRRRHRGATSSVRYSGISQPSLVATRAAGPSTETMPQEIERKFLLAHDGWKSSVVKSARIRDGLVAIFNGRKARVRVIEDHATIALKGAHKGLGRSEFEYTIPISDAEEILRTMCDDRVLEKVRNYVPYAGLTWEIDVYDGILKGVVIAEVELDREDRVLELPDWVGREITGDLRYSKFNMETAAKRGERFW